MKNKKGFTIVELVIVIAVIAILAAVLIPTFSGVVNKANQSSRQQEMTNALKVVLAGNAESGALAKDTVFVLSETKNEKGVASYYSVYNGNKLGEIKNVSGNKVSGDNLTVMTTGETITSLYSQVIVGYDKDSSAANAYDAKALEAITALYNANATYEIDTSGTVNKLKIDTIELVLVANSDLSDGTFVLYK